MFPLIALALVMVDPQLRVVLRQEIADALHRDERQLPVGIEGRHAPLPQSSREWPAWPFLPSAIANDSRWKTSTLSRYSLPLT
jgi:hypothetical protein